MREHALTLLKIATMIFPPLAELVAKAIDAFRPHTVEERELSDEILEILPAETPIHHAVRTLEDERQT